MWTLITDKSFNKSSNKKIIFQNSYIFQHKVIIFFAFQYCKKKYKYENK